MRLNLFSQLFFLVILCFPTLNWAQEECPNDIWYAVDNCQLTAEIGSFVEGEEVIWYFNDDTDPITGGHFIEHTYSQPGTYELCAFYMSPLCPDGVELCAQDIIIEGCDNPCELDVTVISEDCNLFVLEADNYPENANIVWTIGEGTVIGEGNDISVEVPENEVLYICAQYETPDCPEGVFWCTDLVGESCGNDCPEEIEYEVEGCQFTAEIGSFVEGEEVIWYFDDGSEPFTGGHFVEHAFPEPGTFQVCAYYTSPLCPDGVELCTQNIIAEGCDNPCELDVTYYQEDCNWYVFVADNYPENAQIFWMINGEFVEETGNDIAVEVPENEVVDVCAFYETPECPEGVYWCIGIDGEICDDDCPEEIWYDVEGCQLTAEIGSFVEGEEVIWYFNDDTDPITGGHFIEHTYSQPGTYELCAYYTSPLCPDGVELCTQDILVEGCDNTCELDVTVVSEDCNLFVLEADNYPENANIVWTIGEGTVIGEGNDIAVEVPENEVLYICAQYETPDCPEGVFWCTDLVGESCGNDCPEEIEYEVEGCQFTAEIGSFVEGEEVIWYFDDGSEPLIEGHFVEHAFPESGTYQVCAYYTSPLCPDGVELCTGEFDVEGCGGECTPVTFAIDAYIEDGAPTAVTWELSNLEGTFNNSGVAQFSAEDPFYDGEACLPDGCYTMVINPMGNEGEITLDNVFSGFFMSGEQISYVYGPEMIKGGMLYTFGMNSDCGEEDCTLEVEANPQEDGSWYFEAFPSDENAEVFWDFGDGTDASGLLVPHIFENPGIYEVCAFFETEACPEGVWQCVTVVVGEDGECTPVTLIVAALEPIEEDMELSWVLEGDGETQYGEFVLHADCQSTVLNLCLINGCYVMEMSLPGGEEGVPMWMTMMINNVVVEQVNIEPGTDTVAMDFGVNTDCFNSVDEIEVNTSVYPIPARDQINVITQARSSIRWTLTSMSGAVVRSKMNDSPNFVLSANQLAEGMYVLNLFIDDRVEHHRIQVTK